MADRPLSEQLPADLPEDWTSGQIVAPSGADAGLSEQHGYNYLMKQVNAAQRAANAINESFDTISGKRTCRFVIGTSTAGWTQADCDYLCDGEEDQEEFKEAVSALIARGGGELVVLSGEYALASMDILLSGKESGNIAITGNPESTILNLESNFNIRMGSIAFRCRLFGLTFKAVGERPRLAVMGVSADIQSCVFLNVSVSFTSAFNVRNEFRFKDNLVEFDSESVTSNFGNGGALALYGAGAEGDGACVSGNFFRMTAPASEEHSNVILSYMDPVAVIENNTVICSAENWWSKISSSAVLNGNVFDGVALLLDGGVIEATGNTIKNGSVSASFDAVAASDGSYSMLSLSGNQLKNTPVYITGPVNVTGNVFQNGDGETSITVRRKSNGSVPELTPAVIGNFFSGGSVGVHLSEWDESSIKQDLSSALICGNRFYKIETAVRINSVWSGCMVTDNLIDGAIVDNGSGNIIRLNSDDPGGGSGGTAGVASFKGRTGAVVPQAGDYTADMVGARSDTWMPTATEIGAVPADAVKSIQSLTQAEYDALPNKDTATLYLIKE